MNKMSYEWSMAASKMNWFVHHLLYFSIIVPTETTTSQKQLPENIARAVYDN